MTWASVRRNELTNVKHLAESGECELSLLLTCIVIILGSLSHVPLSATPWTVARQPPLSMGCSRQEYWSGLPFPSPGYLSNPGIKPVSPALRADSLPLYHLGGPLCVYLTAFESPLDSKEIKPVNPKGNQS